MKKIQWNITNNWREDKPKPEKLKEYERTLYVCKDDDIWVTVELPAN
ncbi:MAG TPA: hypothetical protein VMR45_00095 [Patescibacteria group bacterium]|nr:hypothetical protein [Patescibacteria group bacterium]